MADQNSGRAVGGWALLAAALAVPGILFYNWWSHLKAEHERGMSAKASKSKADRTIFQTAPSSPLVNPAATSAATAAVSASSDATQVSSAPPAEKPASDPEPKSQSPTDNSDAEVAVTLARDPMMSPMDLVRLREEEIRRKEEADRIRRSAEDYNRERRQERPIESAVVLQGIVATPGGSPLAIVNGATVRQGEQLAVSGHSAKIKVVRIGTATVTFEYKKKQFKKSVSAE